jgi:hypothetical protein
MAQTGFTPIQLYYSSTTTNAPTAGNLANGELAINITDGKLFYKDNANAVQVIGWKVVPATAGGTGQTSYAVGDLLYADTTTTLAKLPDVATGNALISGGVSTAPSWGKIGLTTHVSGTLPVANGGTNLTSFTANGLVYASSTSALATSSAITFDGTNFATTGTATASRFIPTGSTVATNGLYLPAANAVGLSTNSTNAVYIDSSQRVLMGVTSPVGTEKFNVTNASGIAFNFNGSTGVGNFTGDDLNNYMINFVSKAGTAGPHYQIAFVNSTPAVVGSITHNDTITSYNTVSDYRLKKDITPMTSALATVAQLNPVKYKWKSNNSDGQGFIAHELQAVVPDCVVGEKDAVDAEGNPKYQNIDTSFLTATLTAAIKELKAEFDAYKTAHP